MKIEIKFKGPLLGPPDHKGKYQIIKKSVLYTEQIDTESIKSVGHVYNNKGMLDLKRCRITHEQLGQITIEHSYQYISELLHDPRIIVRGFKSKLQRKQKQ